jgi:hypothetical protein
LSLVFKRDWAHNVFMIGLDPTDYSVVVKHKAKPPNPWRWEIYCAGRKSPIAQSPVYFSTMTSANKAGKEALKQFLESLRV